MKFASGALEATRDDSATGLGDTRGANSITKIDSGHELWEYKGNNTFPFLPRCAVMLLLISPTLPS